MGTTFVRDGQVFTTEASAGVAEQAMTDWQNDHQGSAEGSQAYLDNQAEFARRVAANDWGIPLREKIKNVILCPAVWASLVMWVLFLAGYWPLAFVWLFVFCVWFSMHLFEGK